MRTLLRIIVATVAGVGIYLALYAFLGWAGAAMRYEGPLGHGIAVLDGLMSPLGFGLLVLVGIGIAVYWLLPKVFPLFVTDRDDASRSRST